MPENPRLVLHNPHVRCDAGPIVLHQWSVRAFPWQIEHLADLEEPCEAPVAFLLCEPMVGRMVVEVGGSIGIPQNKTKLHAAAPVVGDIVRWEAMLQVDGALVHVVAEREEENSPTSRSLAFQTREAKTGSPQQRGEEGHQKRSRRHRQHTMGTLRP